MTRETALLNSLAPPDILAAQTLIELPFVDFDGAARRGHVVVADDLAEEVREIFMEIFAARFPIYQMKPVVAFGWSDDASMEANNCSGFNFRRKVGKSTLSAHALGRAIDINPRQNPYIRGDLVLPRGACYDVSVSGTLLPDGIVVKSFESRGWQWGGRWTRLLDYHHFEKN